MNIKDFNEPKTHPFDTFGSYEIESFMWWFLKECYKSKNLNAIIKTSHDEDHLVSEGLLYKVEEQKYQLTPKSKGILYSFYGK